MLQNNEKTAEVLKAEKIVEQAKARLAEAKRKANVRYHGRLLQNGKVEKVFLR